MIHPLAPCLLTIGAERLDMKLNSALEYNLDAMSHEDLVSFAVTIGNGVRPLAQARQLFPNRPSKGTVKATIGLRCYAWNKATAIACRLEGKIQIAQQYEAICDRIYSRLPDWAKGW